MKLSTVVGGLEAIRMRHAVTVAALAFFCVIVYALLVSQHVKASGSFLGLGNFFIEATR